MLYELVGCVKPRSFTSKKGNKCDVVEVQLNSIEPIPNGVGKYSLELTVFSSFKDFYDEVLNSFNNSNAGLLVGKRVDLSYNRFGKLSDIRFVPTSTLQVGGTK